VAEKTIEIMDTTLRDGEQTPNVAYAPSEKVQIARLLLREVAVDRIEIANARISEGESDAVSATSTGASRSTGSWRKAAALSTS
jgi:D-citramalate synthase